MAIDNNISSNINDKAREYKHLLLKYYYLLLMFVICK